MNSSAPPLIFCDPDLKDLAHAKYLLESPGFAIRLASLIGTPIEKGFAMLPKGWNSIVQRASHAALEHSLSLVLTTVKKGRKGKSSDRLHQTLVFASGGLAGAVGIAALPIELPISAGIMMRSIADIARSEGHSLDSWETRMSCLEVFALGKPLSPTQADTNYWAVRAAMSQTISEAGRALATRGAAEKSAPVVARMVAAISARFGVVVSEELAAKAIPVIGAASGSMANLTFIQHYQDTARGHFILKRLEQKYGSERVQGEYHTITATPKKSK